MSLTASFTKQTWRPIDSSSAAGTSNDKFFDISCDFNSQIPVVSDNNVISKAPALTYRMGTLLFASTKCIANGSMSATDEETDSLTTEHASRDAHILHGGWLDYISRTSSQMDQVETSFHHPDHRLARWYSPLSQGRLLYIFQHRYDNRLLRYAAFATSPPTGRLTHLCWIFQVSQKPCDPPATHHGFDVSNPARHLPQQDSLPGIDITMKPRRLTAAPINFMRTGLSHNTEFHTIAAIA